MTNESWQQVKNLHPKLPDHVEVQPRDYNGETWYVIQDALSNQFHRFNHVAYQLLGLMDGNRNYETIFNIAKAKLPDADELNTEAAVQLLQYLYSADLLICEAPPKTKDIRLRQQQKRHKTLQQLIKSPFIWRVPLINPNALLNRLSPFARFLTSPFFGLTWLLVVGYALTLVITHWPELSQQQLQEIFSPTNLLLIWLTYPLLKIFHELGHALFTKAWGGDVYECGLVFILGTPLPYVDATSATGFTHKHHRLLVSAAGMAVELFIAAIALFIWLDQPGGLFKNILFNIMLIGGVSTILFNCNPLMRFDGYYILTDLLDSPNLAQRAHQQLTFWFKKNLLIAPGKAPHSHSRKETCFLRSFAILATLYRLIVMFSIVLLAAAINAKLGIALAIWIFIVQLVWPLFKFIKYLLFSSELQPTRTKSVTRFSLVTLTLIGLLAFLPIPYQTTAQGIVWLPEDALLRAQGAGTVMQQYVKDGEYVEQGQALLELYNPDLVAELNAKKISLREYETRYQSAWQQDRTQVKMFEQDIQTIQEEINYLQLQVDALTIRSPQQGTFKLIKPYQLTGSYISRGDALAMVHGEGEARVRTVLTQAEIADIKSKTRAIELKPVNLPQITWQGEITQEVPGGTFKLPSAALGTAGGGDIVVQANNELGTETTEEVFVLDITPRYGMQTNVYGQRVYIRFEFDSRPVVYQIATAGQRLLRKILSDKVSKAELSSL